MAKLLESAKRVSLGRHRRRDHPKINKCNHFDVIENLMAEYPHQTKVGLGKIPADIRRIAGKLLGQPPYSRYLSGLRRRLMLNLLQIRADRLNSIANGQVNGVTKC